MSELKKTIEEWSDIYGVYIFDPDGFDRSDPKLMERKFTEEEFKKGLWRSTIKVFKDSKLLDD